jgi:hypothetical protein
MGSIFWVIGEPGSRFSLKYNRWKHAGLNLSFLITTGIINLVGWFDNSGSLCIYSKTRDWIDLLAELATVGRITDLYFTA